MHKKFPWKTLVDWYCSSGKHDFPWRQYTNDPNNQYRVWLAEILLQQTQADRVVTFYNKILIKYPTIQDLSKATYEEFFPYYQGLGYYSRARNLLKTATIVTNDYAGIFPKDKSLLKKLPGVGEYTARAILAFGYGESILAWDTNLETIFSRYYKGDKQIKLTDTEKEEIEKDFRNFTENYVSGVSVFTYEFGTQNTRTELDGVWGEKLSEADENNKKEEQSDTSFSLPNSLGTFSTKSTEDIIRNINNGLMDWARLMEPKNSNLLDKETYIFKDSKFYISGGETEIIEKKKTEYFPIPDATIVVIIHKDHKEYYSLESKSYIPFLLKPSEHRDTRKHVQEYFRDSYQLELSVRPIHKKWITQDGKPYIVVNAQIQAGNHIFHPHSKTEARTIISKLSKE